MAEVNGAAASLVPSQAMTSSGTSTPSSSNNNNGQNNGQSNRRNRRRKKNDSPPNTANSGEGETANDAARPPKSKSNNNRRRNKPKQSNTAQSTGNNESQQQPAGTTATSNNKNTNNNGNSNNNRRKQKQNNRKRYPWRKFVPDGSVDPITLDPLVALSYPPFALCADSPYVPVSAWPVPEKKKEAASSSSKEETEEERERRVLTEQWGAVPMEVEDDETTATKQPEPRSLSQRTFNLFDGRALAYYMVSQLQFIDPLNRRDLTRDELVELNRYLRRHGFHDLSVVEAYDARGISMSTAGAAASTDEGRAQIRQQEAQLLAQSLLDSVFAGTRPSTASTSNALQQQYAASQRQEQQQRRQNRNRNRVEVEDHGIYGSEAGGLVVIDDDANPGLRGGGAPVTDASLAPNAPSFTPGSLWSASHITNRYQSHAASVQANNFPALAPAFPPAPAATARVEVLAATTKKGPSRSLNRITKLVAKTDQKELQKQRDARELFVKRAAMTNLDFGSNPLDRQAPSGLLAPPAAFLKSEGPSEGQLLRNQAFASALGVMPATVRQQQVNYNEGWARPTGANLQLDEFGNELEAVNYPDSLIVQAREKMGLLLKLEKKWATFLADDKAASLPLNKMDRESRAFVHEYSDHWKLHTESFDREPHRYIHCVKLRDTSAPNPLLSEAARNWRGPRPVVVDLTDHAVKQTAGQTPREFPPPPDREPLQLKPRTDDGSSSLGYAAAKADGESDAQINSRSDELFSGRERPKLNLVSRTLPVELAPIEKSFTLTEERERQKVVRAEQIRAQKLEVENKRRILESAFASDDEEQSLKSHDSAEWDDINEQDALYSGSDEE
mmetsp:Transcript_16774/g.27849  ORF Transcript_16774/g.27849 Transcript_16774/m.27849 type:complete len:844 (+) Transcript_16774:31-2562(+)